MQVVRPTPAAVYTGITHAVSRIASTEGALTMWRGMTSVVLGAGNSPFPWVKWGNANIL